MAQVEQRLVFVISARDENVSRVVKAVQAALKGTATEAVSAGAKMQSAFGTLGSSVGGALSSVEKNVLSLKTGLVALAGSAGLGKAAAEALQFDKRMREIGTLIDNTSEQLPGLSAAVRDVAVAFGQDQVQAQKALYDTISAGFGQFGDAKEGLRVLEQSARLATAGVAELGPTSSALIRVLKGFGLEAGQAEHAADLLFLTVRRGITTIPLLSETFAEIGPQARLAGVSLEEATAAMATLTAGGIPTAEAVTALNRMFAGMAAPASEAGKAMAEAGIVVRKVGADGREALIPLIDVISQFRGLDLGTIDKFMPNIRAVKALATLTENFGEFKRNYTEFMDTAATGGTLDAAYDKIASGPAHAVEQLKAAGNDLLIEFGSGFMDVLGGAAKDLVSHLTEARAAASGFGKDVGNALRGTIAFVIEWGSELKALLVTWAAVRVAVVAFSAGQTFVAIIGQLRAARIATMAWAAEMRAAGAASVSMKLGVAGAVLAIGLMIAKPLGDWLGDALTGLSDLSAELARVEDHARLAGEEFERAFKGKVGMGTKEAAEKVAAGSAVLVESLRTVSRATGEAVESSDDVDAANRALGVGTEIVSAQLIDVAAAAQKAAEESRSAGTAAAGVGPDLEALSAKTGIAVGVMARLPAAVRQAFLDASEQMKTTQGDLDAFKKEAQETADAIVASNSRPGSFDTTDMEARLSFLRGAVESASLSLETAGAKEAGLTASVLKGVDAEAEARRKAAEAEELRLRQIRLHREGASKEAIAAADAEAKALAKAREAAAKAFLKSASTETAYLAASLGERLDDVKAFAKDAAAEQARSNVTGAFRVEFSSAAESQLRASVDKVTTKLETGLGKAAAAADVAMEDGLSLPKALPALGAAVTSAAGEFRRLRKLAEDEARQTQVDLLSALQTEAQGLVDSGRATVEQIAAVTRDPLNSDAWVMSAMLAGDTLEEMEGKLGTFALSAADTQARVKEMARQFEEFGKASDATAGAAVRSLVKDLGDLSLRELLLVRGTLDLGDALQASAVAYVDARIKARELEGQQARLTLASGKVADALSGEDLGVGVRGLRDAFVSLFRAGSATALGRLRKGLDGIRNTALDATGAAASLAQALHSAGGSLGNASLLQLQRLRVEAKALAEELASAAEVAGDKAAQSGDPADVAQAAALGNASKEAGDLGKQAGEEMRKRLVAGGLAVARAIGAAALAAASAIVGVLKNLIQMASDPEATSTFINDLLAAIPRIIAGIAGNLDRIISALVDAVPKMVEALLAAIPDIVDALVSGLPDLGQTIIDAIPELIQGLVEGLVELVDGLDEAIKDLIPGLIDSLIEMMPAIGDAIRDILVSTTSVFPDVVKGIMDLIVKGLPEIVRGIFEALPSMIESLFDGIDNIISGIVDLLVEALPKILTSIIDAIPDIITGILQGVGQIIDTLVTELLPALPKIVMGIISSILQGLPEIIIALVEGIADLASTIVISLVEGLIASIPDLITEFAVHLPAIVIALVAELALAGPKMILDILKNVIGAIGKLFSGELKLGEWIGNIFGGIGDMLKDTFSGVVDAWADLKDSWKDFVAAVSKAWEGISSWFSEAWENIKEWFAGLFSKTDAEKQAKKDEYRSWGDKNDNGTVSAGEWFGGIGSDIGKFFGFQHGGVVPRTAQFGDVLPGLGNGPVNVLAHAGEGFLQKPAVAFAGGASGVNALNRGLLPEALREQALRGSRDKGGGAPVVNFVGGTVFAKNAPEVVDDMTSRSYRTGAGRTARLLGRRYGSMPGQRK